MKIEENTLIVKIFVNNMSFDWVPIISFEMSYVNLDNIVIITSIYQWENILVFKDKFPKLSTV